MRYYCTALLMLVCLIALPQETPTIDFDEITRVYGSVDVSLNAQSNSPALIAYNITKGENDVIQLYGSTVHILNAGTAKIKASQQATDGYKAGSREITFTVVKKNLRLTIINSVRKYGEANPVFEFNYDTEDFVVNEGESFIDVKPVGNCVATANSPVGIYNVTVTGGSDRNYFLVAKGGTMQIVKRPLKAMGGYYQKAYGDENPLLVIQYDNTIPGEGFAAGDNASLLYPQPTLTCAATLFSNCGDYPIQVNGGDHANYAIERIAGNLNISKAIINVIVDDVTRAYGDPNPAQILPHYTGFKLGHDATVFQTLPVVATSATISSSSGDYPIYYDIVPTLKSAYSINYELNFLIGNFRIVKAPFDITMHKMYRKIGEDNPTLRFNYNKSQLKLGHKLIDIIPDTVLIASAIPTSAPGKYQIDFKQGVSFHPDYDFRKNTTFLTVLDTLWVLGSMDSVPTCMNADCKLDVKSNKVASCVYSWQYSTDNVTYNPILPGDRFSGLQSDALEIDSVYEGDDQLYFKCTVQSSFLTDSTSFAGLNRKTLSSGPLVIKFEDMPAKAPIILKGNHTLICMDDSVSSFQWGLGNEMLEGETSQYYYDRNLQYNNLSDYWVITKFSNGCATKSNYDGQAVPLPMGVNPDIAITVSPNPNDGKCTIRVKNLIKDQHTILSIHRYSGIPVKYEVIPKGYIWFEKAFSGLEGGIYLVKVTQLNRTAIAKMIVKY